MAAKKKILFIMNPISGTVRKTGIPKVVEDNLDKDCFDFDLEETRYSGHAYELATDAKVQGYDAVVAVGGDGTVNEVARAIVHSDIALGIVPCGSGNGLARHLMLPMMLSGWLQHLFAIRNPHPADQQSSPVRGFHRLWCIEFKSRIQL